MFDFIVVICYVLALVIGYHRGAVKIIYKFISFFLSLYVAKMLYTNIQPFLEKIGFLGWLRNSVEGMIDFEIPENLTVYEKREFLEGMNLPKSLVEFLARNNNIETYARLGVERFDQYITSMLSVLLINLASILIVFLVTYIGLNILSRVLNVVEKLPIIGTVNKWLGTVCQVVLFTLYVFIFDLFLVITLPFSAFDGAREFVQDSFFGNYEYISGLVFEFILSFFNQ